MPQSPEFHEIEIKLLEIMRSMEALTETVKWGAPVFVHAGRNIVAVLAFKHFVSVWFYDGVFLKDQEGKLIAASDGKTKALRQWRFTRVEEIDESLVKRYVSEAIANAEKGIGLKAEPKTEVEMDIALLDALNSNANLKNAFHQLSKAKQREYIIYVAEAKQETTKFKRIEKISPQILNGMGLNEKYKR
jgi:uncharacterized protein YdeI (YjbR/CyaY-like superfamily)